MLIVEYLRHVINSLNLILVQVLAILIRIYTGDQGEELKKMIGAVVYIECSSKTQQVLYIF